MSVQTTQDQSCPEEAKALCLADAAEDLLVTFKIDWRGPPADVRRGTREQPSRPPPSGRSCQARLPIIFGMLFKPTASRLMRREIRHFLGFYQAAVQTSNRAVLGDRIRNWLRGKFKP
jgi:hypothetical protein